MFISYERTIRLNSPAEWIYQYLTHPATFMSLLPHDTAFEYTDMGEKRSGGFYYNMTYTFMRMKMITLNETATLIPNQQVSIETRGHLSGLIHCLLDADESGTRVTFRIEYKETPLPTSTFTPKFSTAVVHQLLDTISETAKYHMRCPDIEIALRQAGIALAAPKPVIRS